VAEQLLQLHRLGLELRVAPLGGPPYPVEPALHGREIREQQLRVDGLGVALGVDLALDVDHVLVHKAPDDVRDGVALPDVAEKLVAQALPRARPPHQPGYVHEIHRRGHDPPALHRLGERVQAPVGTAATPRFGSMVVNG
jgi:hypothetical protein